MSHALAWRTSPVAFLANSLVAGACAAGDVTCIRFPPPRSMSGRDELTAHDAVRLQHHDGSPENPLAVLAARVEAEAAAQSRHGARLVDVPVRADERLVALDHPAHGR